jgi:ABC-type antimicrobial peptide transport system permease subunit
MVAGNPNSIVIFESTAKKMVGEVGSLVGKEIKLADNRTFYIAGVLKDPPVNSRLGTIKKFFFWLGENPSKNQFFPTQIAMRNTFHIQLYKNASKQIFLTKLKNHFDKDDSENQYELEPFTGSSISDMTAIFGEYTINIIMFLFVAGLLILLATLSNFVLFQLSLYYNRFKEYGIRIVHGVNRRQFTLQLFVDTAIKFLLSGFIVFLVMETCYRIFDKTYYELTYIHFDLPLLRGYLLKYMLYGVLLSFLFSVFLSHNLLNLCKRSIFGQLIHKNIRNRANVMLLFIQLAVIALFISAAGIVKLQVDSMKRDVFSNLTPKERENILFFPCNYPQLRGQHEVLPQKILDSKHVLGITRSDEPIIRMMWSSDIMKITGIEDQTHTVRSYQVALNFFDFFNGHSIQGETSENARNYDDAVVVNKNFLKLFPGEPIIGKTFEYAFDKTFYGLDKTYRIVGVIDNIQLFLIDFNDGVEEVNNITENDALFFKRLPAEQSYSSFYVKYQPGMQKEAKQHIEACLREFIPDGYEIVFETLQGAINNTFSTEKIISLSSVLLFFISLILGLLNIYSSVLMNVEKRKKEIAIRKINGAEWKDIIVLLGKTYFILWTLVCFISFPFIYFYAIQWLERYKEPVSINILLFVLTYIVILIFIALTVLSQLISAIKSNPAEVVKQDN